MIAYIITILLLYFVPMIIDILLMKLLVMINPTYFEYDESFISSAFRPVENFALALILVYSVFEELMICKFNNKFKFIKNIQENIKQWILK
jgi:hypothetical protein